MQPKSLQSAHRDVEKGMATLHVRNVPDELYERIRRRAAQENRSLSAEVVALLVQVTQRDPEPTTALFDRIRRRRQRIQQEAGVLFPSGVEELREDRAR
jgi:plasmid stability protein